MQQKQRPHTQVCIPSGFQSGQSENATTTTTTITTTTTTTRHLAVEHCSEEDKIKSLNSGSARHKKVRFLAAFIKTQSFTLTEMEG